MTDASTRETLLALARRDDETRRRLVATGELFQGYHPAMEQVHRENAAALDAVLDAGGWPSRTAVGDDGSEAAWRVAQHAIGLPAFQRRCRALLEAAVRDGAAPAWQLAFLVDRIRFNERRPQVYGTILDWDEAGALSPWTIEVPTAVDERRTAAGLPPLADAVRDARAQAAAEGARPPASWAARQAEIAAWARAAGWC